jgi:hypothetical protein
MLLASPLTSKVFSYTFSLGADFVSLNVWLDCLVTFIIILAIVVVITPLLAASKYRTHNETENGTEFHADIQLSDYIFHFLFSSRNLSISRFVTVVKLCLTLSGKSRDSETSSEGSSHT